MSIDIGIIILIITMHFVADFIFQTEWQELVEEKLNRG